MTTTICEAASLTAPSKAGTALIQIITPGVGSSGVYPAEVLEAAAHDRVFPAGTQMFADHPGMQETSDRPERSIRDLAGVLTEDARWDGGALVATAQLFDPWRTVIGQMKDAIGVSIRATGTVNESDDQGRPILASLDHGISVDFVTRAGRGGAIRELYESARPAVAVTEALPGDLTADDLARRLEAALGPDTYVQDHTDEWVVYIRHMGDRSELVQQTYTADEQGRITLTGDPVPVARRVTYDALTPPSAQAGSITESREEPPVAQIQIDEAEHKRLTTAAERVTTIEAERDQVRADLKAARTALAEARQAAETATIERIIAAAPVTFTALERAGLTVDLPRGDDEGLDAAAFESRVAEAAASARAVSGEGRPTGVGTITESTDYSEADYHAALGIQEA